MSHYKLFRTQVIKWVHNFVATNRRYTPEHIIESFISTLDNPQKVSRLFDLGEEVVCELFEDYRELSYHP